MNIIRKIILLVVIFVLPFSANGITLVRHFCCGTVEKTDIVLVATNDISEDNHHENGNNPCCDDSNDDSCCSTRESNNENQCGDQVVIVDGTDETIFGFTKTFDQLSLHEFYCVLLYVFESNSQIVSKDEFAEKPEILAAKEYCPSKQVLRL